MHAKLHLNIIQTNILLSVTISCTMFGLYFYPSCLTVCNSDVTGPHAFNLAPIFSHPMEGFLG